MQIVFSEYVPCDQLFNVDSSIGGPNHSSHSISKQTLIMLNQEKGTKYPVHVSFGRLIMLPHRARGRLFAWPDIIYFYYSLISVSISRIPSFPRISAFEVIEDVLCSIL